MDSTVTATIHLRAETQPMERRSPVSPSTVKGLLDAGYHVRIEHSPARIYGDEEFRTVGVEIVPENSWATAPKDHIILGLNQIAPNVPSNLLSHTHIHFANPHDRQHQQTGSADEYLGRFVDGGGTLFDMEYLTDGSGRRVASFSYWTGYAGAAMALLKWSHQVLRPAAVLGPVSPFRYPSAVSLVEDVVSSLSAALEANSCPCPKVLILGAKTRAGKGAIDLCRAVGVPPWSILEHEIAELRTGTLISDELAASDILINCVHLCPGLYPSFLTQESLSQPGRKLSVLCDTATNTAPTFDGDTDTSQSQSQPPSFNNPTMSVPVQGGDGDDSPPLTIVSLDDDLSTLVAREASDEFSQSLLPVLLTLDRRGTDSIWTRARQKFLDMAAALPSSRRENVKSRAGDGSGQAVDIC